MRGGLLDFLRSRTWGQNALPIWAAEEASGKDGRARLLHAAARWVPAGRCPGGWLAGSEAF